MGTLRRNLPKYTKRDLDTLFNTGGNGLARHYIVSQQSRDDSAVDRKSKINRHHKRLAAKRRQSWRHHGK